MESKGRKLISAAGHGALALAATLTLLAVGFGWLLSQPDAHERVEQTAPIVQSSNHQGTTAKESTRPYAQEQVEETVSEDTMPVGSSGLRATLNPETGELGLPTAAQRFTLSELAEDPLLYSHDGLVQQIRPDGTRHVNLEGRFQSHAIARLQADGSLVTECIHGPDAAPCSLDNHSGSTNQPLPLE